MNKGKGVLGALLFVLACMMPVNANESADEIVAMMSWWDEYGRYWDEMGVDSSLTATDEDAAFAWLTDWFTDAGTLADTLRGERSAQ